MASKIVERLRQQYDCDCQYPGRSCPVDPLSSEAADEIEGLQAEVSKLRTTWTPPEDSDE